MTLKIDHLVNEQPKLKPVATTKVNQSTPTTESNRDEPLSTNSVDQDQAIKDQPFRQKGHLQDVKAKSVQEAEDWSNRLVVIRTL